MEVLAQRLVFTLLLIINIPIVCSDCQAAVNSVRAVIHLQLKRALGAAPAGILLAGFPAALTHMWNEPVLTLTYQDWGIVVADSAESEDWSPFYNLFDRDTMAPALLPWTLLTSSSN
jgi:hypothetical protein